MWGDGKATRSFIYITDTVEGICRLMDSDHAEPINIGTDRMVSVDELARLVMLAAGYVCEFRHVDGPQGVRGRNADLHRMTTVLDWSPRVGLEDGQDVHLRWIESRCPMHCLSIVLPDR